MLDRGPDDGEVPLRSEGGIDVLSGKPDLCRHVPEDSRIAAVEAQIAITR